MGVTKISWCDHSVQPGVYGCEPAHTGCRNCYAAKMAHRLAGMGQKAYQGLTTTKYVKQDNDTMREVVRWTGEVRVDFTQMDKAFAKLPKRKPCSVFCTSMGDLLNPKVPYLMAEGVLRRFEARPHLTGLILTKHPGRMATFAEGRSSWPSNVMAGCSISDQPTADRLLPDLLRVKGARLFVSYEPAIGPVNMDQWFEVIEHCGHCGGEFRGPRKEDVCKLCGADNCLITTWGWAQAERYRSGERYDLDSPLGVADVDGEWAGPHQVIIGCESGPGRRPMQMEWAESMAKQCEDSHVACFIKQLPLDGEVVSDPTHHLWPSWAVQQFPGDAPVEPQQPTQTSLGVG